MGQVSLLWQGVKQEEINRYEGRKSGFSGQLIHIFLDNKNGFHQIDFTVKFADRIQMFE